MDMQPLELLLDRKWKKSDYTIGRLFVDGEYFSNTLEDTDRGLTSEMTAEQIRKIKIQSKTAIPTGRYKITLSVQSPKYKDRKQYAFCKGYLPRLQGVKGYAGILIHCGNFAKDTDGCILVGENKVKGAVCNSTMWFQRLYKILEEADKAGREIWITIK